MKNMSCNDCKYYNWYYDICSKWNCEVDAREVHNQCFQWMDTPLRDIMVGGSKDERRDVQ